MELEIGRVIEACDARVLVEPESRDGAVLGLTWDSREVKPGFVYAAIIGERVDGHAFAVSAIEAGAVAVLCTRELDDAALEAAHAAGACVLKVADTAEAIAEIAAAWRATLCATVIGVTGSVGKTTTKGLVRDILSTKYETWATKGNFNNELGAPYTVLTAPASTQMLVVEMGMDRPGQIAHLAAMAKPNLGVVSIVGTSHLEYLKTRDNIALAKAELLDALIQAVQLRLPVQGRLVGVDLRHGAALGDPLPLLPGDRWAGELFCLRRKIAAGRNGQNLARSIESSSIVC